VSAHPANAVATWLWKSTEDIRQIVEFATARDLREVYLAIPLDGVDARAAALAAALRANGIAVSPRHHRPRCAPMRFGHRAGLPQHGR
jgi:hypothetical protein